MCSRARTHTRTHAHTHAHRHAHRHAHTQTSSSISTVYHGGDRVSKVNFRGRQAHATNVQIGGNFETPSHRRVFLNLRGISQKTRESIPSPGLFTIDTRGARGLTCCLRQLAGLLQTVGDYCVVLCIAGRVDRISISRHLVVAVFAKDDLVDVSHFAFRVRVSGTGNEAQKG